MTEEWRSVPGWEGLYEASSLGRVRSLSRIVDCPHQSGTVYQRHHEGRVLKPATNPKGYFSVPLYSGSKKSMVRRDVHWMVCSAFHGPAPSEGLWVAHWDNNQQNNVPGNLRWATPKENAEDRIRHGTQTRGVLVVTVKLKPEDVLAIRANAASSTITELGNQYGVQPRHIRRIQRRSCWAHI